MFLKRQTQPGPRVLATAGVAAHAGAHSCPSMARVLGRVLRERGKPEVLDLGPLCGETVIYLASRGARVSVEEFTAPLPLPKRDPKAPLGALVEVAPVVIGQPSERFDLVLAWEHLDFTPPERLAELGAELHRVLAPAGWLLVFCRDSRSSASAGGLASRYRLIADDQLIDEPLAGPGRQRYIHPNRDLERALAPLKTQGIHLQRSGVREILALKA